MAFVSIIAAVILAGTVFGIIMKRLRTHSFTLKEELAIIEYSISI